MGQRAGPTALRERATGAGDRAPVELAQRSKHPRNIT
jgi:hypothetical protein